MSWGFGRTRRQADLRSLTLDDDGIFFLRLCNFGKEGLLLVNKYFREWLFCSRSVFPTTFIPSFAIHFSRASPFYSFLFLLILLSLFIITIYMLDLSYNTEGRY
jgi:hypothetical protein